MTQDERRLYLLKVLLAERPEYSSLAIPPQAEEQKILLRGLMNIRPAAIISDDFLAVQDAYLQEATKEKGITTLDQLTPLADGNLYLWQGDITTLQCDAIVNAANSGMTGCYVPNHHCIDNAIHTYAGVQLRLACDALMQAQGHAEETGRAKLTKAYNLPCRYVLHTVGPIVEGALTDADREALAASYTACLTLAAQKNLESVAFCCISTGVFHFPPEAAVAVAIGTVRQFLQRDTSVKKVIFNVFKDQDYIIYRNLLQRA